MGKKILYLDEARQHTLSAGPQQLLRLVPGRNVVDEDLFEAVLNSGVEDKDTGEMLPSMLQDMIDEGKVVVKGEKVNIGKMNVKNSLETIELEATEDGLEDLLVQETAKKDPRKTVVKAIEDRLDAIRNPKTTEPPEE